VYDPLDLSQGPYSAEDFQDNVFLPGATYTCGSGITPSGVQGLRSDEFDVYFN